MSYTYISKNRALSETEIIVSTGEETTRRFRRQPHRAWAKTVAPQPWNFGEEQRKQPTSLHINWHNRNRQCAIQFKELKADLENKSTIYQKNPQINNAPALFSRAKTAFSTDLNLICTFKIKQFISSIIWLLKYSPRNLLNHLHLFLKESK